MAIIKRLGSKKHKKIMKSIRRGVEFLRIEEKNEDHHKRGWVLKEDDDTDHQKQGRVFQNKRRQ